MKYWMKSSEIDMTDSDPERMAKSESQRVLPFGNITVLGQDRSSPRHQLVIIGYGNPLRGDDGVGWRVADQLAKCIQESVEVLTVHQLTPELAEAVSQADSVIFVDACYCGQAGNWTCETIHPDPNGAGAFTHYVTPTSLLSYVRAVFNVNPKALLISIAGSSFDCGEELSSIVASRVPDIVACVCEWWRANAEETHA
jgi:hydrogenase maturation protease